MINLGNGDRSAALMYSQVTRLIELQRDLSGLQQGIPTSDPAWDEYKAELKHYLKMLENQLTPVFLNSTKLKLSCEY